MPPVTYIPSTRNKIEDIVHRPKDVTRLQQELKDMGEDEDIVYEYEEDVDDDDDIDYEYVECLPAM